MTTGKRPQDNFDAARLVAALMVLYGHAYYLTGLDYMPGPVGNEVAAIAVKVFFVISGYLISESWRRDPSPARYIVRRGLRIFPGLAVNILVCAFVLGPCVTSLPIAEYLHSPILVRFLANIALLSAAQLPGVFDTVPFQHTVNGSLWTLPVEFAMYLVAPFVLLGMERFQRWRVLAAAIALCSMNLYLRHIDLGSHGRAIHDALNVAPYFLLGAAWRTFLSSPKWFNAQIALFGIALLLLLPKDETLGEFGMYVVLPYATLSFALARPAMFGFAGRLGDLSYGIYIYAFPVQQTVALLFHTDHRPMLNATISIVPTLLLAACSWHLLEKRCLKFKPRRDQAVRSPSVSLSSHDPLHTSTITKNNLSP
ncbi:acyltransferase [Burkholderia sp. 3C]